VPERKSPPVILVIIAEVSEPACVASVEDIPLSTGDASEPALTLKTDAVLKTAASVAATPEGEWSPATTALLLINDVPSDPTPNDDALEETADVTKELPEPLLAKENAAPGIPEEDPAPVIAAALLLLISDPETTGVPLALCVCVLLEPDAKLVSVQSI
jgi:hypothetical protein